MLHPKTWMAGTSSAKTRFALLPGHDANTAYSMLALQILIDGFAISALYALGATGFTLIFGVSGVLNLSHGAIMVLAAVAAWAASSVLHVGTYAGAIIGVATALVGGAGHLLRGGAADPEIEPHSQ